MEDNRLQEDELSLLESATEHHWNELRKFGATTFHSDKGDLTIVDDTTAGCETHLQQIMKDAINDYYG